MQFPVSSGQHHRANENEWVPVVPTKKDKEPPQPVPPVVKNAPPVSKVTNKNGSQLVVATSNQTLYEQAKQYLEHEQQQQQKQQNNQQIQQQQQQQVYQQPEQPNTSAQNAQPSIFPESAGGKDLDVTSIITQRLNAMRKLQDNPHDSEALKQMYNTQKDVSVAEPSPRRLTAFLSTLSSLDVCLGQFEIRSRSVHRQHWRQCTVTERIDIRIPSLGEASEFYANQFSRRNFSVPRFSRLQHL